MKKLYVLITTIILISLSVNVLAQKKTTTIDPKSTFQKFSNLLYFINTYYVEDIEADKLTEDAIIAMLKTLDPHSIYISKKDVKKMNEPLEGNFDGVGIQFQIYQDTIMVIAAIPGGPSDALGIMSGDKIIKINDIVSVGEKVNNQFVFDNLRGPKGSVVDLTIKRANIKNPLVFSVKRDKIPINSIDAAFILKNENNKKSDIGYIKLSRFARTSVDEFKEALKPMLKDSVNKLILDLRGNTGGYLDIAYDLTDEFIPKGNLIVYTEGKRMPRKDFTSRPDGLFENGRIVVLIDESSASASEILAGAIQDLDRGVIMGRRSFGKGLVQIPYMLPDSSMVRITTSRYYTPSGRCIQKPFKNLEIDYRQEIFQRHKHGEMIHADSIQFPDSLKYYTKSKRVVYGGGGIMPDYFIPMDTSFSSKYLLDVLSKGILNNFATYFVEKNRKTLKSKYKSENDFINKFEKDYPNILNDFVAYAKENKVEPVSDDIETSKNYINNVVKALISRSLFEINTYYKVISNDDNTLKNAIDIINNDNAFKNLKY